jgi:glutaredoxin
MRLTIYSKPGCHLCDEMKAIVARTIQNRAGTTLEEIDISNDPALLAVYELEIPVLFVDGKKAAKYRITEEELARRLSGARGGMEGARGEG